MEEKIDIERIAIEYGTRQRQNVDTNSCISDMDDVPTTPSTVPSSPQASNRQPPLEVLGWKERLRHFTWTWFTMSMATGGIAAVLHAIPEPLRFPQLYYIGLFFMILNICIFIMNCVCIGLRFYFWPKTISASIRHPSESLFVPAIVISICIILINITQYGMSSNKTGEWLTITMAVLYWLYIATAVAFSSGLFLVMWSTQTFTISQMTPTWIFPAYPLLLAGPFAGALSDPNTGRQGDSALRIIVSGVIVQGIGFMVSLMVYSAYLYRLMTQKLPAESLRPGMFISVGPSGFTIMALIYMGNNFAAIMPDASPEFMGDGQLAGGVTRILASWAGIWLWGLALWFFFVSVGAHVSCVSHQRMHFAMTWNSFIFPNTALAMATFAVAHALGGNRVIEIVGCVMTVALIVAWLFVNTMAIRAVVLKQILWPQKQEDRDSDHWTLDLTAEQLRDASTGPALNQVNVSLGPEQGNGKLVQVVTRPH